MGLHRDIETLFKHFMAKNFSPRQHKPSVRSIQVMQIYSIRKLIQFMGDPKSYKNATDVASWAERFKRKNESLFMYLSNPGNIEEIKRHLEKEKEDLYSHPYFQTIDQKQVKDLKLAFNKALSAVVIALERRATGLKFYNTMSNVPKDSTAPEKKYLSKLKPFLELGSQNLQKKILRLLKTPTEEKLKKIKSEESTDKLKAQKELELSNVLKNISLLPLPFQQALQSNSDVEMLEVLKNVYESYSKKRTAGVTLHELYEALKPLRGRIEKVHKAHYWITQELKNVDRPYQIRNPQYLVTKMESFIRNQDQKGLVSIVNKYVSNNNVSSMTQGLYAISPALSQIFYYARTNPSQLKLGFRAELYEKEKEQKEVNAFKADPSQIMEAILDANKMKTLEKKGFNFQAFVRKNRFNSATKLLYSLQNEVVASLMEKKNSLVSRLKKSDALNVWLDHNKEKLVAMDRLEREAAIQKMVLNISKDMLDVSHKDLKKKIQTYYGDSIKNAFGAKFYDAFISKTISSYYSNSVMSYVRAVVVREVRIETAPNTFITSVKGEVNPFEMGFKGMRSIYNRIKNIRSPHSPASGISTVSELNDALIKELKNLEKNNGFGSRMISNLVLDIAEMSGRNYMENKLLIDEIRQIANDNETLIDLYVTSRKSGNRTRGGSGDVHPTETKHPRISEEPVKGSHTGKVKRRGFELDPDKKSPIVEQNKKKKEFDPLRKKREEEARQKKMTLDLLKDTNPRLAAMIRSTQSTRHKTGIESDPRLRAILKGLYDTNIRLGLSGGALEAAVERQYKKYLRMASKAVYEEIGKDPDFARASKLAKVQILASRYDEMRSLFTAQGSMGDSRKRNNSLVSEANQQEEMRSRNLDQEGLNTDFLANEYNEAVARSNRAGGNTEGYIFKHTYSSIPYMIEQAKTAEELEQVKAFINDIIPLKHLRSVEKITAPEYSVYEDENKKPLKFKSLMSFMSYHEERILKNRTDEVDGILKTGAQPLS